jgi:hypothetical protein
MIVYPAHWMDSCELVPVTPPRAYVTGVDLHVDAPGNGGLRLNSCRGDYNYLLLVPPPDQAIGDRWWYDLDHWNGQPASGCWFLSLLVRPETPAPSVNLQYWMVRVYYEWRLFFPRVVAVSQ